MRARVAEWLRVLSGLAEDLPETLDEQVWTLCLRLGLCRYLRLLVSVSFSLSASVCPLLA